MDRSIKTENIDIFEQHLGAINDSLKTQLKKMSDELIRKNEKIKELTSKIDLYKKQLQGMNDFYEVRLKFSDENHEKLLKENKILKEQLNERTIEYSDMVKTKNQLIDSLNDRLKVCNREIKDFQNVIKNIHENKPQLIIEDIRKSTTTTDGGGGSGETIVDTTSESTRTRRDSIESNSSGSIIFVEEVVKQTRRRSSRRRRRTTNETTSDEDFDDDDDDDEDEDEENDDYDDKITTKKKTVNINTNNKTNSSKRSRPKKKRKLNSKNKELRCKYEECNMLFNTIGELIRHKREHRRFRCKCNKLFMSKFTLRAHLKSAHGI